MKGTWMLCLILAGLLCGCAPTAREPDELALVRVLGVDGRGPVGLTAVCGVDTPEQTPVRGVCQGMDFAAALDAAPWSSTQELSLTSVSQLLVGENVCLDVVLRQVLEDEELGATATVWVAQGGAEEVLQPCENPQRDLTLLLHQGEQAPTVVEALAALSTWGEVELPVVRQEGGRLVQVGRYVWEE